MHETGVGGLLYAVAAAVGQFFAHELVDPDRGHALVAHEAEVLVEGLLIEFVAGDENRVFCHYSVRDSVGGACSVITGREGASARGSALR